LGDWVLLKYSKRWGEKSSTTTLNRHPLINLRHRRWAFEAFAAAVGGFGALADVAFADEVAKQAAHVVGVGVEDAAEGA